MRKIFPTFAVLMAIMLAIWLLGCGEDGDVECEDVVEVDSTTPENGGDMAANAEMTVKFTGTPDANSVMINGKTAKCVGTTCKAKDLGLTMSPTVDIEIKWTYCDGKKIGQHNITVNTWM